MVRRFPKTLAARDVVVEVHCGCDDHSVSVRKRLWVKDPLFRHSGGAFVFHGKPLKEKSVKKIISKYAEKIAFELNAHVPEWSNQPLCHVEERDKI